MTKASVPPVEAVGGGRGHQTKERQPYGSMLIARLYACTASVHLFMLFRVSPRYPCTFASLGFSLIARCGGTGVREVQRQARIAQCVLAKRRPSSRSSPSPCRGRLLSAGPAHSGAQPRPRPQTASARRGSHLRREGKPMGHPHTHTQIRTHLLVGVAQIVLQLRESECVCVIVPETTEQERRQPVRWRGAAASGLPPVLVQQRPIALTDHT